MSKRMMLVAASALAALAFAALPAFASAAASVDNVTGVEFTGTFGTATLTSSNGNVVCGNAEKQNHVSGKYTSSTTGTIHLLFTKCTFAGFTCTGSGLGSGEITVTGEFHVINIDPTTAGVLITVTPLKFSCLGQVIEVKGNVIGDVSAPGCNEESASSTLTFAGTGGVQKYQQIETTGTKYHLESNLNGGAFSEASQDATSTTTLVGGGKGKLTC